MTWKRIGQAFLLLCLKTLVISCLPDNKATPDTRSAQGAGGSSFRGNVTPGFGVLLNDNPIILSGNKNLSPNADLNRYLGPREEFLVLDEYLNFSCSLPIDSNSVINNCVRVRADTGASQIQNPSAQWHYDAHSSEFLQVNTFGHLKRMIDRYFSIMGDLFESSWGSEEMSHLTSLPANLISSNAFWAESGRPLNAYADCNFVDNAFFSASQFSICMGRDSTFNRVRWAHDPTIIYHEMGHAFNYLLMNVRNRADDNVLLRSKLGTLFYDEGNAIEEGLADFASFVMNNRPHLGEWTLGRFNSGSRPMSEAEGIHIAGIDTTFAGRLSYPHYVTYDPNFPDDPLEGVHFAGQIISHYLVALTKKVSDACEIDISNASKKVLATVMESLVELGDLTARGKDFNPVGHINHSPRHSFEWIRINNPINYRSLAQSMARNVKSYIIDNHSMNCHFTTDDHEVLLDSYGLLLFRTYNESGNHPDYGHQGIDTFVSPNNRVKTVLLPKKSLTLNPDPNASKAFIFDIRSNILNGVSSMIAAGQITGLSHLIESDLPYNNGNGRPSPGEVIGILPNLYNNSNSMMGGIQVLANDWDHFVWEDNSKPYLNGRPCGKYNNFPSPSEGGARDCGEITRQNGDEKGKQLAPFCIAQVSDESSTRWASQNELRKKISLPPRECLGGEDSLHDCFIRSIRGADQAFYSYIKPKKTWAKSIGGENGDPTFNYSNLIFLEINPWTPPGTTFNCRFRVRFTNCDDCFHDPETDGLDFLDFEYSGARPFKVLDYIFTVID